MTFLTHRTPVATVAATSICALALSACSATGPLNTGQATLATAGHASPATQIAGLTPLGDANISMKTQRVEPPAQLLVTGVRTGKHEGFERVVFDLEGSGEPGWFIDYTEKPTQQGSGKSIDAAGATALNVNIDGTVMPFKINKPDPKIGTVEGQGGFVTEVIPAGTFEGRTQFVIGLEQAHPYSVQVLDNPTRLVIDILKTPQK